MDPISHGVIGLGIAALSGGSLSLSNPIFLGSVIGSMAPDLDIIMRYKGDYTYLRCHRGFSHSLLGIGCIALMTACVLTIVYSEYSFGNIFLWTLVSSLSHSFFDMLNSYGVRFLLPFSKRKFSASLITLYNPFLILVTLIMICIPIELRSKIMMYTLILLFYLCTRFLFRIKVYRMLRNKYHKGYMITKINIMPSTVHPFKWDFVIESTSYNLVGQINFISKKIKIRRKLKKTYHVLKNVLKNTELGKYFWDFTPIRHLKVIEDKNSIIIKMTDLRYLIKNKFLHNGTIIFDKKKGVISEIFYPFNMNNRILVKEYKLE